MMLRRISMKYLRDFSQWFQSEGARNLSVKSPMSWKKLKNIEEFVPEKIRNFSIIAHVDHGKSTLADRILEFTGAVEGGSVEQAQLLDRLQVERERGITVKAQTATLFHEFEQETYLLNLIDTPGHVDFHFEVKRSLAACESVVLLVDANEGVQAQTVANFYLAFEKELTVIPVLNKVDLPRADPMRVKQQLKTLFDIEPSEVLEISAKFGRGIQALLSEIIRRTPSPSDNDENKRKLPARCLLIDSWFEPYRGAIAMVVLKEGVLKVGDELMSHKSGRRYTVKELGIFTPEQTLVDGLFAGQVGYVVGGMKSASEAVVGDTLIGTGAVNEPLQAIESVQQMVFAGLYPTDQSKYGDLKQALEKLTLNDSSVSINNDLSPALGSGWRLGFLGLLHMDVFRQRLEQEHKADLILTVPNVPYKVRIKGEKNISLYGGEELMIYSVAKLPHKDIISEFAEPIVTASLIFPEDCLSTVLKLCQSRRGVVLEQTYIDTSRLLMRCDFPLSEIVVDFYDRLKSETSGYASLDFEEKGFQVAPLVKLEVLINDVLIEELAMLVHSSRARHRAKSLADKLGEEIPRQQYLIRVQVCHNKTVLAKAEIRPYRKDVLQKIKSGTDPTRKMKLLKQQSEGKKRMRLIGRIEVPREAFINVLKQD